MVLHAFSITFISFWMSLEKSAFCCFEPVLRASFLWFMKLRSFFLSSGLRINSFGFFCNNAASISKQASTVRVKQSLASQAGSVKQQLIVKTYNKHNKKI